MLGIFSVLFAMGCGTSAQLEKNYKEVAENIERASEPEPEKDTEAPTVLVWVKDLKPGHVVTSTDVKPGPAPTAWGSEDWPTDADEMEERVVLQPVFAGEVVREERLAYDVAQPGEHPLLPRGMVSIDLTVPAHQARPLRSPEWRAPQGAGAPQVWKPE